MRNTRTLQKHFFSRWLDTSVAFLLSVSLTLASGAAIEAAKPETAPPELKTLMSQIETAANGRNLQKVMEFYSPKFTNSDGLTYETMGKGLSAFWERYSQLQYNTTLQSWEKVGDKMVAETMTQITGSGKLQGREITLNAKIRALQHFQNQKLVYQEIISERIEMTSGKNPPLVEVRLPETVKVGQEFDFDVIVQEPLGDSLLAGTALDEKVEPDRYLDPKSLDLELLPAGGIFKRAKAPDIPENRWLSAVLIRGDGIFMVTQRVKVEK